MIFRHYLFANITEAPKSRSDIEENREMSNWTACPVRVLLHKKNTIFGDRKYFVFHIFANDNYPGRILLLHTIL